MLKVGVNSRYEVVVGKSVRRRGGGERRSKCQVCTLRDWQARLRDGKVLELPVTAKSRTLVHVKEVIFDCFWRLLWHSSVRSSPYSSHDSKARKALAAIVEGSYY